MPDVDREATASARRVPESALPETGALNLRWAEAFVSALADAGVREAVIAPGSRSAPLAVAFHRSSIQTHVALDERAGAYFALGLAKASRRPAAVLCTSGTAAANFHPAILEAHHARVPLVALTADRPPELRDTGAPQTIDQIKLFGEAVRWFCEVGTPSPGTELARYVASLGHRAAAVAWRCPAGPVHLNFAFREPLLPSPEDLAETSSRSPGPAESGDPMAESAAPEHAGPPPTAESIERAARLLRSRRRGLILCGPEDAEAGFAQAVHALSVATGYPVLADPLSGLRYGLHDRSRILGSYDLFLRAPGFIDGDGPDAVVTLGAAPTSKTLDRYLARFPSAAHVVVDAAGAFRDPGRRAERVIEAGSVPACRALAEALAPEVDRLPAWMDRFTWAERTAREALSRILADGEEITECALFPALLEAIPEGAILFAGNSMPIRDLDSFAPGSDLPLRSLANRGVNGIDGVVSTALGASAASDTPLLAVVGDLSFHHDLNALSMLREGRARATIVIVNNDGGGIFSFLPVARHEGLFERYFGTPHGFDFSGAATLYRIPYSRPQTRRELVERAADSLRARRSEILEVRTDRRRNVDHHRALLLEVSRALGEAR